MASRRAVVTTATVVGVVLVAIVVYIVTSRQRDLVLTGIVTTNDVVVSSQVTGQIGNLLVKEGDTVQPNQLLAVLVPGELRADQAYYAQSEQGLASEVQESEAALRFQQQQTAEQIRQAQATLDATLAQRSETAANLRNAAVTLGRDTTLARGGVLTAQDVDQARTAYDVAKSRSDALDKQIDAARAAVALAQSAAEQVAAKQGAVTTAQKQKAAAAAQTAKASVRLGYAELRAPVGGIVDVEAARLGEVVNPGQPVITLLDPNAFWVRADVEESYIDQIKLGDSITVRLPSGETRRGAVFYRGMDAGYATQRDVSRTKRDIKTFEIRIRVDNRDRALAVGMTAYVLLHLERAA
ncbi:MAG TPA: efflux RND transporter periplasmic adaptor subunit [Gemmatimonadaceae bacterium]|jgi:multidrug resistance efflux pump